MTVHPIEKLWRDHGLPEWFLGNGGTNTKLYALYDTLTAPTALAATPAVGGEALAYLHKTEWGDQDVSFEKAVNPQWTSEPLYAAQPASPLRERESIRQILNDHFWTGEPGQHGAIEAATNILSASPPEQPATAPDDVEVIWLREIDAGTDNACWVLSNRVDSTAVAFVPLLQSTIAPRAQPKQHFGEPVWPNNDESNDLDKGDDA